MKRTPLCCALLLAMLLPPTVSGDTPEETRRAGQRLVAVAAARELVSGLEHLDVRDLEELWASAMLRESERHSEVAHSRQILQADLRQRLEAALAAQLRNLQHSLHPDGGERWFSERWLIGYVQEHFDDAVRTGLDANVRRSFAPAFAAARGTAVERQLAERREVQPPVATVEALAAARWAPERLARERSVLVEAMSRGRVLLEEAQGRLDGLAAEILEQARGQYRAQRSALTRPLPEGVRISATLESELRSHLEKARREWAAAHPGAALYPPFPSIVEQLRRRARRLEIERFRSYAAAFPHRVDGERVRRLIEEAPAAHRERAASLELCRRALLPAAVADMLERYVRPVGTAEREGLRARLRQALRQRSIAATLSGRFDQSLEPVLDQAREEVSGRQLGRFFPEIASRRWSVPEVELLQLDEGESAPPEGLAGALRLLDRRLEPADRSLLLDETEERAVSLVNELLDEGRRAWAGQEVVIDHLEGERDAIFAARGGAQARPIGEWQEHFVGLAQDRWARRHSATVWPEAATPPPRLSNKYAELFPHKEELLRLRVLVWASGREAQVRQGPQEAEAPDGADEGDRTAGGAGSGAAGAGGGGGGGGGSGETRNAGDCPPCDDPLAADESSRSVALGWLVLTALFAVVGWGFAWFWRPQLRAL